MLPMTLGIVLLTLGDFLDELFSTYHEWHYFIVGFAIGALIFFVLGWMLSLRYGRRLRDQVRRATRWLRS